MRGGGTSRGLEGMTERIKIGWREWLELPDLGIPAIKAKVDTGARTSSIYTFFVEPFEREGLRMVRFGVHPLQGRRDSEVICEQPVKDYRQVSDSGGHREMRYVIETNVRLGVRCWPVEITLSNRNRMRFRMLLGRTALGGIEVIPEKSYIFGRRKRNQPEKI